MAGPGAVAAALRSGDELLLHISLPPTGKASLDVLARASSLWPAGLLLDAHSPALGRQRRSCRYSLCPPPAGRASDNVAQLKREAMAFMTSYMQAQKMDTEEGAPLQPDRDKRRMRACIAPGSPAQPGDVASSARPPLFCPPPPINHPPCLQWT